MPARSRGAMASVASAATARAWPASRSSTDRPVAVCVTDLLGQMAVLTLQTSSMSGEHVPRPLAVLIPHNVPDLVDGQVDPAQGTNQPGESDLAVAIAAIARYRIDHCRRAQSHVVVMPQRMDR